MVKIKTVKAKCPNCKTKSLIKRRIAHTKRRPHKVRYYSCTNCNKYFNLKPKRFKYSQYNAKIINIITKLSYKEKISPNKYDNKKSIYYSSREITNIINKKLGYNAVSKTGVWNNLKKLGVYENRRR